MRASRLISTMHLLQTRGRMTADALAETLEVSVRTVYRDIEALGAAGIPIVGVAGREGGYSLVDGYRSRLTGLAAPEAASLFLMGVPDAAHELGYGEALSAAKLKLLSALPDAARVKAQTLDDRFLLDAAPWYHDRESPSHLPAIARAVWARKRLRIGYERWAQPRSVTTRVDPLGLVLKAGQWYLVANTSNGLRTYRAARVASVVELDDAFTPPRGFALARAWKALLHDFDARRHIARATLRLPRPMLQQLAYRLEPTVARDALASARAAARAKPGDDRVEVDIPIESLEHALTVILPFGVSVEVVAPAALRDRMREEVRALERIYRAPARRTIARVEQSMRGGKGAKR